MTRIHFVRLTSNADVCVLRTKSRSSSESSSVDSFSIDEIKPSSTSAMATGQISKSRVNSFIVLWAVIPKSVLWRGIRVMMALKWICVNQYYRFMHRSACLEDWHGRRYSCVHNKAQEFSDYLSYVFFSTALAKFNGGAIASSAALRIIYLRRSLDMYTRLP